jgi:transposase
VDSRLGLIDDFDREVEAATREIDALAKADERVDVLTQIRGVGPHGDARDSPKRTTSSAFRAPASSAPGGLTPTVRSSDGKARFGNISQAELGHPRWGLVEAAQHTTCDTGSLAMPARETAERRGRRVAKVAVARTIATLCF